MERGFTKFKMLEENIVVKLNKDILKRFEHNLNDGVLFLSNVQTDDLWIGNESSNELLKLIDGKKFLKEIYTELTPLFEGYDYDKLRNSFDAIVSELLEKGFLEKADSSG